uniref:Carboxypeptidase n=1 Tax=Saccoglossus kowalevskii TaxID=10224 RepID=A0ABM0M0W3_SACKO|nr:PREDICTED: lysosomal protective protein-like [Saccoglossus kowalevskii]
MAQTLLSLLTICIAVVTAYGTQQTANPDEITSLPGLKAQPKFKQYSGYLNVDNDGVTLYNNEYSWNKAANVIFLEAPAGVGFSYSDDKNYTTDDDQTATDNYAALQHFFVKYPAFVNNSFYITGESYGGIYVPTLSMKVMKGAANINMKGFAVGNGLSSRELNDNSLVYFAYYYGVFGDDLWTNLNDYCCNQGVCNFHNNTDANCQLALHQVNHFVFDAGLNEYALYMDCAGGIPPHYYRYRNDMKNVFSFYHFELPKWKPHKVNSNDSSKNTLGGVPPCLNVTAITNFLNQENVRKALHIPSNLPTWAMCNDNIPYTSTYDTMYDQYKALLQKYKGLVYNGDTDMACNFLGDQWFVESLNLKETQKRQAWIYKKQVAGFYHRYENITFATVKGSGHMVPQWKPGPAYQMITNFLAGIF